MSQAIPKAQAPDDAGFLYHLRAPNDDLLGYFEHLAKQGDFVQLGSFPAYFVNHPDYAQQILVTQATSFSKPRSVKYTVEQMFGTQNLFSSDDAVWKALRKAMQPAFHMRRISGYLDLMVASASDYVNSWQDGQQVNMEQAMMDVTMSVTTKALFSQDLVDADAGQAILEFLDLFNQRITSPLPVPAWLPLPSNSKMKSALETINALVMPIIEERKQSGEDAGDLLSMLLDAQQADDTGILTDLQVRNEVLNLFAAGYEVTGNTLAFTLYLIATHENIAEKLYAEIDTALADNNGQITLEAVQAMPYLEQVLKESMRLYPVTAVVSRTATERVQIDDYVLPKNAQIFVAPWTLHRREDIFPQPELFQPERFAPENEATIPKHAYLPFSTGPRICLGNAFAMLQMQATLASILSVYRLRVPDDYTFEPFWRFNTRPKNGMPMMLSAR
ncbi:MAG: cytochrome P450 [Chloroflexota bacterium]